MISYLLKIVEDKEEGGFVVSYPELPGCITCGETIEIALENALDAKKSMDWSNVRRRDKDTWTGQFKLRISRSLHRSLAEHAQREGMSMNQNCLYLLSRNDEKFSK